MFARSVRWFGASATPRLKTSILRHIRIRPSGAVGHPSKPADASANDHKEGESFLKMLPDDAQRNFVYEPVYEHPTARWSQVPDVPPLPPRPPYPCPFLTQEDITTYLVPLYHHGWIIGNAEVLADDCFDITNSTNVYVPQLGKLFEGFVKEDSAVAFAKALKDLQNREKHHADVCRTSNTVQVLMHTHTALPPPRAADDAVPDMERVCPGLTLRDVHLAIGIEKLFAEFRERGEAKGWSQVSLHPVRFQPHTPEEIKEYGRMPHRKPRETYSTRQSREWMRKMYIRREETGKMHGGSDRPVRKPAKKKRRRSRAH
ncbi:hypothetical protein SCP_1801680 [Sparassis crispa]|uniref:Uncharacterized protein n=1 Tax=Sparassis crispa TaxID=139825 RepID=A0A401H6V1_9APHY|nr:hypothetical protein SCP_1801680 [Sparassis crispa]GBE90144.1 hypothetical protein SCP_1801680 [Sparassis crispa]